MSLWAVKGVLLGFLLLHLTSLIGSDLGFGSPNHARGVQGSFFSGPLLGRQIKQHKSFLDSTYRVVNDKSLEFCVRQVPGDGSCLFHSISAWLSFMQTGQHKDFDWRLRGLSLKLRHLAVRVLQQPDTTLTLEDGEEITTTQLVDVIAEQYNIKPAEYCTSMLDPRTWGGGPEIVALSHHLKCPIHVYQLCTERSFMRPFSAPQFKLEVCAKFGSPKFDAKEPICILCADGRYVACGLLTMCTYYVQSNHMLASCCNMFQIWFVSPPCVSLPFQVPTCGSWQAESPRRPLPSSVPSL